MDTKEITPTDTEAVSKRLDEMEKMYNIDPFRFELLKTARSLLRERDTLRAEKDAQDKVIFELIARNKDAHNSHLKELDRVRLEVHAADARMDSITEQTA